jgi:ABC-type Fe3+/spermidine/putrescine transport system ATPase subunit
MTVSDRVAVQSRGEVLQVGTPEGVYDHPSSVFVATFIGKGTLVEGTVRSVGKYAEVEVDGFRLRCIGAPAEVGKRVSIVLRPENFTVTEPQEANSRIDGTVEWVAFVGSYTEIKVRAGERSILAYVPPETPVPVGGAISLYVPCRRTIILQHEDSKP